MNRRLYLAAYDIADTGRLRASLVKVKAYATGGQKSAYECWLSEREKSALLQAMNVLIDHREDAFALVGLDPRGSGHALGTATVPVDPDLFFIN